MKAEKFNILGMTNFRVKNQVYAYSQLLQFLETELSNNEKNTIQTLNSKFIKYCKEEGLYNYSDTEKIKRLSMAIKLLRQIKIIDLIDRNIIVINYEMLKDFYEQGPENFFFQSFISNFPFFQEGINFLIRNSDKQINLKDFIITLLIYDSENEKFDKIYDYVFKDGENNYQNLLTELAYNLLKSREISRILPKEFYKYKKPPFGQSENKFKLISFLTSKKNKTTISQDDYYFWLSWDFRIMYKNGFFGTFKENGWKFYEKEYFEYIFNVSYENLILDLTKIKIYKLIFHEYYDLNKRWFNDFNLISEKEMIKISDFINKNHNNISLNFETPINQYPFKINEVEHYLNMINENDFSFKLKNDYLKQIANSTLAEYFVNLCYSIKNDINPLNFVNNSRTLLQSGTLYPSLHAPGKGPDLYHIIDDKKLRIIETTIHKNKKMVRNNEVFCAVDHADLNSIDYIGKEAKKQINQTEIILVTPLKKEEDLIDIKKLISLNLNKNKEKNTVDVTNFYLFSKKEW